MKVAEGERIDDEVAQEVAGQLVAMKYGEQQQPQHHVPDIGRPRPQIQIGLDLQLDQSRLSLR